MMGGWCKFYIIRVPDVILINGKVLVKGSISFQTGSFYNHFLVGLVRFNSLEDFFLLIFSIGISKLSLMEF